MPQANGPFARRPLPPRARIAVLRALALGDLLCAVPALRALRAANPEAEVTLIGLPWASDFAARFDRYVDRFLEFPGFPGIPERPVDVAALTDFLRDRQAEPHDLVIQLQGNGLHSNGFVELLGARQVAGFYLPASGRPNDETFAEYPGHAPEIRRHLALMEFLGFPSQGEHLEFPLLEADEAEAERLLDASGVAGGRYVVVHPGASVPQRRWPAERFARIADCVAERGLRPVITGTSAEGPIAEAVAASMREPVVNLAGRTSLGGVAALIARSRLLVSNDTSVAHIAAALDVPSVTIFLASERARWAALDERLHEGVGAGASVGCRNHAEGQHRCLRDACIAPRPSFEDDVSVERVWAAVERRLDAGREAADAR